MIRRRLPELLLVVLVALVYANSLANQFAWDDGQLIVSNDELGDWSQVPTLFKNLWRPLKRLSFMLDHALWGKQPLGYHLSNMLWHMAATLALLVLARRLGASGELALAAAALFAVHPVHVEAVANISNRKEMMATFFYLLAFLAWLPLRERPRWLVPLLVAFVAALLSKESAPLMLPVVLLVWELGYRRPPPTAAQRRWLLGIGLAVVALSAGFMIVGEFATFGLYFSEPRIRWITQTEVGSYPLLVGNSLRAFAWDLGLMLWPQPLIIRHWFRFSRTLADPRVMLGLVIVVLFVLLTLLLRRRSPLASFGLAWTGLNLLPFLNLVPLTWWFVSERYLYLPSAGLCLAAAHLFFLPSPARIPPRLWRAFSLGLLLALVGAAGARTIERNADWGSSATIIFADLRQEPDNPYMLYWAASVLQESGDHEGALELGRRSIAIHPNYHAPHFLVGQLLFARGRVDEAARAVERSIELNPYADRPWSVLGRIYLAQGKQEEALDAVSRGLDYFPHSQTARYLKADVLLRLGRIEEAELIVNDLVAEDPDYGFGLALKARMLARGGELPAALELYRKALRNEPRNAEALLEAAHVAASLGRTRMARRYAERALEATESATSRAVVEEFLKRLPPAAP